jgi:hypothetical protein
MRDASFHIHDRFHAALRAIRIHARTRLQENGRFSKLIRIIPCSLSIRRVDQLSFGDGMRLRIEWSCDTFGTSPPPPRSFMIPARLARPEV